MRGEENWFVNLFGTSNRIQQQNSAKYFAEVEICLWEMENKWNADQKTFEEVFINRTSW